MFEKLFEKANQLLRLCLNWSIENKTCRLRYEPQHVHIINQKDLPFNCNGYGNPQTCCWYKYEHLSDRHIKKIRNKLRGGKL